MENVTREFNNVAEGYRVDYDDSTMEYNVINIKYEFCELNTQDEKEVQFYFDNFITLDDFEIDDSDFDDLTI